MTVRRAQGGDLAAIHDLESMCFSDPWSEEAIRNAFGGEITEFVVIEDSGGSDAKNFVGNRDCDNNEIYGYAMFSVVLEDAEVLSVAVAPNRRGCGAGRALMQAVLERSVQRGACRCFLEVRSSNVPARALYTSLGFTELRTIRRYYRQPTEDAVVMSRELC